jgi:hypothetical protein
MARVTVARAVDLRRWKLVAQDLLQALGVVVSTGGAFHGHVRHEGTPLSVAISADDCASGRGDAAHWQLFGHDLHLARLDLGQVKSR